MSEVLNDPKRKPINSDAARILRRMPDVPIKTKWTEDEQEDKRWDGLISKCPSCGDRAYEGGFCFGCGRPLAPGAGLTKKQKKKKRTEKE